ncbi:VOC family protein [Streptomyces sp. NPDC086010]|uniref:VOC family protein n=1 Tax=Streptomyces sp. NPDC086010 TaxID=3365745 RepID=UPI0037CDA4B0
MRPRRRPIAARSEAVEDGHREHDCGRGDDTVHRPRSWSPPEHRPRIHLDPYSATTAEPRIEAARLVRLGARAVERDSCPADPGFVVLADPDGSQFCVVDLT